MSAEDSSWSTVGIESIGDIISDSEAKEMEEDTTFKEELKAMTGEKDLAYKLIQAMIRTDTLVDELDTCTGREIRDTIKTLVDCSIAMEIPELKKKAAQFGKVVVDLCPTHAISVMLGIERSDNFIEKDMADLVLTKIRANPAMLISNEEVTLVSENQITAFLTDREMEATEAELFHFLAAWVGSSEKRRLVAREQLLKHINLTSISPCELGSPEIRDSGIVTDTELLDIILKQLAGGEPNPSVAIKNVMGSLVWSKAQTPSLSTNLSGWEWEYDSIRTCDIQIGTYEWKVRIDKYEGIFLGVTNSAFDGSYQFCDEAFVGGGIHLAKKSQKVQGYIDGGNYYYYSTISISEPSVWKFQVKYGDRFSVFLGDGPNAVETHTCTWDEMALGDNSCIPVVCLRGHSAVQLVSFNRISS